MITGRFLAAGALFYEVDAAHKKKKKRDPALFILQPPAADGAGALSSRIRAARW